MTITTRRGDICTTWIIVGLVSGVAAPATGSAADPIGREVAISRHLRDGEETRLSTEALIAYGEKLFEANWTGEEGGGRPVSKGTGVPLADPTAPLLFPRNFNRISGPDANSCAGCHNAPFGIAGGGGDIVTNVFVLGQRFDFATFDQLDSMPTRGAADEHGAPVTLQSIANSRSTLGMFGSGFIEMLARQMTFELQRERDSIPPAGSRSLESKGVSFGVLARRADGSWDTSRVEGLAAPSLASTAQSNPPSLILRPFHQSGSVPSLRVFTNNAFNHHHGIQAAERFGDGVDADGDGFVDELTRADVTAAVIYQATLPVPGRMIPSDARHANAITHGERLFDAIGCAECHVPALPLDREGWIFSEPGPFNPAGNAQPGSSSVVRVDLTSARLPGPRLKAHDGVVYVPAYTDLKLHDITSGPSDPNREPIDMNQSAGSAAFFSGNAKFLTRKLWGVANEPPFFHHGEFTTLRQAVLAHAGEASRSGARFRALRPEDQDNVIEFLKSLQVLPPGARNRIVD